MSDLRGKPADTPKTTSTTTRSPNTGNPRPLHQSSPHGVGDDVARDRLNVFLPPQRSVMEPVRPRARPRGQLANAFADERLEPVHHAGKVVTIAKLDQPVPVIGHEDPAKRCGVTPCRGIDHLPAGKSGWIRIEEPWKTKCSDGRKQVGVAGNGDAASAQRTMARSAESSHVLTIDQGTSSRYGRSARIGVGSGRTRGSSVAHRVSSHRVRPVQECTLCTTTSSMGCGLSLTASATCAAT